MPRKPEPSLKLKMMIWDIAAAVGKKPEAIRKQLDYDLEKLRRQEDEEFYEDAPDVRTIRRIIEKDINELPQEFVMAKLPSYMWHLRQDYENLKLFIEGGKTPDEAGRLIGKAVEETVLRSSPDSELAQRLEVSETEKSELREKRAAPQVRALEGLFDLAVQLHHDLGCISAKDGAVWQLSDAPWLSSIGSKELPTVLDIWRYRGELRVDLAIEEDKQFSLLTTRLEAAFPEFRNFQGWEQSLPDFIGKCQEICREIWYAAESRTYMKMSQLDTGYGFLCNVPLFTYEFALDNYDHENSPQFEVLPYDAYRYKLTPEGRSEYPLAVGTREEMMICEQATVFLCNWYTHEPRIGKIKEEEAKVRKQAELLQKVLSQVLNRSVE